MLSGAVNTNFWKLPLLPGMLIATEIILKTHQHDNTAWGLRGGGGGEYFMLSFGNDPNIFGQECSSIIASL